MNREEINEKLELYGRGYDLLTAALAEVPAEAWKFKPAPAEWSVHEIIIHLADSETNAALRARKLAVEPGGTLMGYDQDRWAKELDYHGQDADDALQLVKLARQTTYRLLKTLPDEVFSHSVVHPEYSEPYTFEKWLSLYSAHIPGHIEQIKNNVRLWRERK
ncbi:MAG: DinB family protein [Chloroflexota bacterium]